MTLLKKRYRIVLEVNYLYNSFYGKIEEIADTKVIINVNDIGYEINMPENHITKIIDKKEEKVKIYTHFHVREDDMRLFGFLEKSTLNFFEKLISVSGVGPKVALGIISNINVEEMCMAIINEDINTMKKIPGIGPKMAQKIIFELKDKVKKENLQINLDSKEKNILKTELSSSNKEAIQALEVLGFDVKKINEVIVKLNMQDEKTEDIIKVALKELQKM